MDRTLVIIAVNHLLQRTTRRDIISETFNNCHMGLIEIDSLLG